MDDDHREKARFPRWFLVLSLLFFFSSSHFYFFFLSFCFCCVSWRLTAWRRMETCFDARLARRGTDSFVRAWAPRHREFCIGRLTYRQGNNCMRIICMGWYGMCIWHISAKSVKCNKNHADISFWLRNIVSNNVRKVFGLWMEDWDYWFWMVGQVRLIIFVWNELHILCRRLYWRCRAFT